MEKNDKKTDSITISLNTEIYPLDVIYSAAYVFIDKAYVFLDGNPEEEILVTLTAKEGGDILKIEGDFKNELLHYSNYRQNVIDSKDVRTIIMQKALFTSDDDSLDDDSFLDDLEEDLDFLEDPEDIAVPWEEKNKNKSENDKPKD